DILPQNLMVERVNFSIKNVELYKRHLSDVKFQIAQDDELEERETDQSSCSSAKILELARSTIKF
ncbi:2954_t:CDS:1, partial [Acaulospora morrowiae]